METAEKRALSLDELEAEVAVELPDRELMGGCTYIRITNNNNNTNNNTNSSASIFAILINLGG